MIIQIVSHVFKQFRQNVAIFVTICAETGPKFVGIPQIIQKVVQNFRANAEYLKNREKNVRELDLI